MMANTISSLWVTMLAGFICQHWWNISRIMPSAIFQGIPAAPASHAAADGDVTTAPIQLPGYPCEMASPRRLPKGRAAPTIGGLAAGPVMRGRTDQGLALPADIPG
jgi:hypothetical protein